MGDQEEKKMDQLLEELAVAVGNSRAIDADKYLTDLEEKVNKAFNKAKKELNEWKNVDKSAKVYLGKCDFLDEIKCFEHFSRRSFDIFHKTNIYFGFYSKANQKNVRSEAEAIVSEQALKQAAEVEQQKDATGGEPEKPQTRKVRK